MKTLGILKQADFTAISIKAWGYLMTCTAKFPEINQIVSLHRGCFCLSIAAITAHVVGGIHDHILEIKESIEQRFAAITTQIDFRSAITYFSVQQNILQTIDKQDPSFSETEGRNFLLRCCKRESLSLVHIFHQARTDGDDQYDTYPKLKKFLESVALKRLNDSTKHTTQHTILDAATVDYR
mmetsp:Transcript_24870/g.80446  ORF Transcript_24870/g.80446 Transcript_24870/m.80446 type:complete len:182 (-) Transcript_24870:2158-2703(-)